MISGFRREVDENCDLLGYGATSSGDAGVSGQLIGPETSVRNYHYSLRNNPKELSCHVTR